MLVYVILLCQSAPCYLWQFFSFNDSKYPKIGFLDASSHLYKRVCPLVRRSVGPSVGNPFFSVWIIATLSDSGQLWTTLGNSGQLVDASIGQLLALFLDASSHLYKRVCPSVRRAVGLGNSGQLWATLDNSGHLLDKSWTSLGQLWTHLLVNSWPCYK